MIYYVTRSIKSWKMKRENRNSIKRSNTAFDLFRLFLLSVQWTVNNTQTFAALGQFDCQTEPNESKLDKHGSYSGELDKDGHEQTGIQGWGWIGPEGQNVLKLVLKSPRVVPFGANLAQFTANPQMSTCRRCRFDLDLHREHQGW